MDCPADTGAISQSLSTDEEYEICGHELAEGFLKHLLYLEENEGYKF